MTHFADIGGRHRAADVVTKVAEAGSIGDYAHDVPGELLGAALWRITQNSHETDLLAAITRGWQLAETEWRSQVLHS